MKSQIFRLFLTAPPLEYMSMLHSKRQEISGRQVWTGSYVLANVLLHNQKQNKNDNGYRFSFSNQRYRYCSITVEPMFFGMLYFFSI